MDGNYYVDVVTRNILSALSEHISDSISDQLITIVKKTTAQLDLKLTAMFEAMTRETADSINRLLTEQAGREQTIDSMKNSLADISHKLDSVNTAQIEALAKSVETGLSSFIYEIKSSFNDKAQLDVMKATIESAIERFERVGAAMMKMALEGQLRDIDDMAQRIESNKKAIKERLKSLEITLP